MITKKIEELLSNSPKPAKPNKKIDSKRFIRVGDDYYMLTKKPTSKGDAVEVMLPIKKSTLIDDYGKSIIYEIKKFKGFVTIPSHTNYKKVIKGFYNRYFPIKHQLKEGKFENTERFLKHIFGKYYEIGLDYLTILWQKPSERLPIICLVSTERSTGKTTFLNWLKFIYGENFAFIGNSELESEFNEFFFGKLILAIDETFIEKRQMIEKIKNLSTSEKIYMNAKHRSGVEIDFFGKFIMTSNNVYDFIRVDDEENRYFVLELKKLEKEEENFVDKLKKEVPAFLFYLNNRTIKHPKETRFWFAYHLYRTEAFERVVFHSLPKEIKILRESLIPIFLETNSNTLYYSIKDLKNLFFSDKRIDEIQIKEALEKFKIEKYKVNGKVTQKRHDIYWLTETGLQTSPRKDYPYVFTPQNLKINLEEYESINEPTLPF